MEERVRPRLPVRPEGHRRTCALHHEPPRLARDTVCRRDLGGHVLALELQATDVRTRSRHARRVLLVEHHGLQQGLLPFHRRERGVVPCRQHPRMARAHREAVARDVQAIRHVGHAPLHDHVALREAMRQRVGSVSAVQVVPNAHQVQEVRAALQVLIGEVHLVAGDRQLGVERVDAVVVDAVVEVDAAHAQHQAVVADAIDRRGRVYARLSGIVAPPGLVAGLAGERVGRPRREHDVRGAHGILHLPDAALVLGEHVEPHDAHRQAEGEDEDAPSRDEPLRNEEHEEGDHERREPRHVRLDAKRVDNEEQAVRDGAHHEHSPEPRVGPEQGGGRSRQDEGHAERVCPCPAIGGVVEAVHQAAEGRDAHEHEQDDERALEHLVSRPREERETRQEGHAAEALVRVAPHLVDREEVAQHAQVVVERIHDWDRCLGVGHAAHLQKRHHRRHEDDAGEHEAEHHEAEEADDPREEPSGREPPPLHHADAHGKVAHEQNPRHVREEVGHERQGGKRRDEHPGAPVGQNPLGAGQHEGEQDERMDAAGPLHRHERGAGQRVEHGPEHRAGVVLSASPAVEREGEAREVEPQHHEQLKDPLAQGRRRYGRDEVERVEEHVEGHEHVGAVAAVPLPHGDVEAPTGEQAAHDLPDQRALADEERVVLVQAVHVPDELAQLEQQASEHEQGEGDEQDRVGLVARWATGSPQGDTRLEGPLTAYEPIVEHS